MKIGVQIVVYAFAIVGLLSLVTRLAGGHEVAAETRQSRFQLIGNTSANPGEPFLIKETTTGTCWLAVRNGNEGIAVTTAPTDACK
jgi:hypothetical protein